MVLVDCHWLGYSFFLLHCCHFSFTFILLSLLSISISALCMLLRRAKRLKVDKLMIYANLQFIRKNLDNLSKWSEKNWCHGKSQGKGKPVVNRDKWQKIHRYIESMELNWVWMPKGNTFKDVMEKAAAMALLTEDRWCSLNLVGIRISVFHVFSHEKPWVVVFSHKNSWVVVFSHESPWVFVSFHLLRLFDISVKIWFSKLTQAKPWKRNLGVCHMRAEGLAEKYGRMTLWATRC